MTADIWTNATRRPLVIAHRGGALLAAENSAAAFRAAEAAGADAVETDVRRTADGALVCFHDESLQRLCGDPRTVANIDLATLKRLLPSALTLGEALSASGSLGVLLDVKLMDDAPLGAIVAEVVAAGATDRTILGLRDLDLIKPARRAGAQVPILLLGRHPDGADAARQAGADWFRLWQGELTETRAAAVRQSGMRLAVMVGQPRNLPLPEYPPYPVGKVDAEGLRRIQAVSPDAIMLDDPRLLVRVNP